ncbi:MAG: transcriptional repressor LexA [Alphaproteobacteria bacterium]|nr:transcriptional repressor LexA [Alphaproteobacteria bacterium]
MLTKKQRDLLLFIHERMKDGDIAPSFDEMKEALGLKSKSGVHRLITGLVERGYLERLPHRARALEIKRLPEGYRPDDDDHGHVADLSRNINAVYASAALDTVPLYGRIAAGTPIEALRDEGQTIDLPPGFIGSGAHYALTVDGDSMIKAGINNEDIVIIRRCDSAEDGQIVVALVDGEEATLKRLYRRGGKIVLKPENDDFEEQVYDAAQVRIQGRLVSLLRTYQ